ncbi:hypothetical protein SLS54_008263 [Diplodia seriata]
MGQRILGKTRKRFAKEKYDKVHNNGEKGNRHEGDKGHNPSPVRWPFSSPTTGTFDEDSQQSNEEEEGHIKTENKEKRPLLHRRGIISEINIAIDSIAEFADSDEEDTVDASPFPITTTTTANSLSALRQESKAKTHPTDSRHHFPTPTPTSTRHPRFQPLRAPPRPPAGGSATATGISTTTHAGSENLALDAFYREALAQVCRILDTHVEMAKERMEGRGRREEGGEGEGDGE